MPHDKLREKARLLLARRDSAPGVSFYVRPAWKRKTYFAVAYVGLSIAFWFLVHPLASMAFAGFFIGHTVRDIRWWHALSKEWPTTVELLDWPKIQRLAEGQQLDD